MGILISLFSALLSSSRDLVSKHLAFKIDGITSAYASFAFAIPYYVAILLILRLLDLESFHCSWAFLGIVLARSLCDAIGESLKMHALSLGDISIVAPLFSIWPLFVVVIAPFISGDTISFQGVIAIIVVVFGSALIGYRPRASSQPVSKQVIVVSLLTAVSFSISHSLDRLVVREGSPVFSGFAMTLCSGLMLLPWILRSQSRRNLLQGNLSGLWLRGAFETAFMITKLCALTMLGAPQAAAILRISLLFSIIGGKLWFKEPDFHRRFLSGLVIMAGIVWLILVDG